MEADLTTFVTEAIESDDGLDALVYNLARMEWIEHFPDNEIYRPVDPIEGRAAIEVLVKRGWRTAVMAEFKTIHYAVIEGE